MALGEYNAHVTRCAQTLLGLHPTDRSAAQAAVAGALKGMRDHMVGGVQDAVQVLRYSASAPAVVAPVNSSVHEVAWQAHLADVRARVITLP